MYLAAIWEAQREWIRYSDFPVQCNCQRRWKGEGGGGGVRNWPVTNNEPRPMYCSLFWSTGGRKDVSSPAGMEELHVLQVLILDSGGGECQMARKRNPHFRSLTKSGIEGSGYTPTQQEWAACTLVLKWKRGGRRMQDLCSHRDCLNYETQCNQGQL